MKNQKNDANSITEKSSELQPFYVDQSEINIVKRGLEKALEKVNVLNDMIKKELGELSPEKMQEIPKNGIRILWQEVRSRYQFPDASDDFNLKALGINFYPLIEFFDKNYLSWQNFGSNFNHAEFIYKNGKYHLADVQPSIDKHYYFVIHRKRLNMFRPYRICRKYC